MMDKLYFGRQPNYGPLIRSLIWGLIVLLLLMSLSVSLWIAVVVGICVMLALVLIYYPVYLFHLYGRWLISESGIQYLPMKTYGEKLQIILFPKQNKFKEIQFKNIQTVRIISRSEVKDSSDVVAFGAYIPEVYMPWMLKPHLLEIKQSGEQPIYLDLSWDLRNKKQVTTDKMVKMRNIFKKEHKPITNIDL
ncbi:hypothetical protein GA840_06670 [Pediococcus ethanolidurans]|uniref:hypothetical protein n=1 Tax=Pediococcus ethanolidurans TaxID=319653 RepID=UPI002953D104|nr:hypothetical protein [Pediococcus ethanolidurans]MDV7719529.1 hypothetical protein [Pediococcus ethanolidurans]